MQKRILKYWGVVLTYLLFSIGSFANDSTKNIISYQHIGIEQGLASRQANCGLQDSRGFVWIGTTHGLQRYDGKNFKTFTKEKDGLQDNVVSRIIEDDQGQLWIMYGLYHGFAKPEAGKVDILDLKTNKIQSFAEKFKGKLPFEAKEAGLIYSNEKKEFIFLNKNKSVTANADNFWDVYYYNIKTGFRKLHTNFTEDDLIYYKGDYLFSQNSKNAFVHRVSDDKNFIIDNSGIPYFKQVFSFGKDNTILYSTYLGGAYHVIKSLNLNAVLTSTKPVNLEANERYAKINFGGIIFTDVNFNSAIVYLDGQEIILYDNDRRTKILDAKEWSAELKLVVFNYFTTKDKKHWICTSNGIYKVSVQPNKFNHLLSRDVYEFDNPKKYQTRNIMTTNDGKVFLNSWGGTFEISNNKEYKKIPDLPSSALYTDGAFFDGTNIFRYTRQLEQQYNVSSKKTTIFKNNYRGIWTGIRTKIGQNIVATYTNIALQKGSELIPIRFCNGTEPPENWIQQFYYTKDNTLWAVGNNGIFIIDKNNCISKHYSAASKDIALKIPVTDINSMHEDKNGIIWLVTVEAGLVKWDRTKNSFENYTINDGLSSNLLYGILEDEKGLLWISSDFGLMRFDPQTKFVKIYSTANGITNNEFNRCCFAKAKDGMMLFGGIDGVNSFYPKDFWGDTTYFNAPLKIVSFNKFNNDSRKLEDFTDYVLEKNSIILNPEDDFFTLEFQLQDYNGGKQRYAYMIDGIDNDWNYINENSIRISGLPYGEYTLKVKGQNSEGSWSSKEISIPLTVVRPLIKKWWFIALLAVLSLGIIYAYFKYRTHKLAQEKKALEQTVDSRTRELNESLQQKEVLLKEIHHRVKNNLSVISGLLDLQSSSTESEQAKLAMQESQNRISAIALIHQRLYQNDNMGAIEIKGFVEDMYGQIATVFSTKDIKTKAILNLPNTFLDIDTSVPLGLIINELITNSFKYAFNKTNEGIIKIELVEIEIGHYTLTYQDNGPGLPLGFDFSKEKTLGIKLIRILSKQLSGKAEYKKENDNPTFVIDFKDTNTRNNE
jgi:two-component sensor histidine kinase